MIHYNKKRITFTLRLLGDETMKKKAIGLLVATLILITFTACSEKADSTETISADDAITNTGTNLHETISASTAKEMIDRDDSIIILDVRTKDEYNEGHIENALLLPDTDVESKAEELLPDKDATILVYCRSGRRSALSATKLDELGYTNVYDFGGIIDWPYDIVTE